MNFHLATKNVRLENGRYLIASISVDDKWEDASLDLDLYVGNNNGFLSWGGSNFSQQATEIRLRKDAKGGWCPVLEAKLLDSQGVAQISGLYLGRCIGVWKSVLVCDISKAHLTVPVLNPQGGFNYFARASRRHQGN